MSTSTDADRSPGAPPRWLLPTLVAALLVAAAVLAFAITSGPAAPAAQAPLDQPQQQAGAAQASAADSASTGSAPAGHGGLNPDGPAVEVIALADAKARLDAGTAIFIDVRSGSEWAAGHIPGALTITSQELESRIRNLPQGAALIAYGDAERPESGQRGAQIFMEMGYPPVIALEGGFQRWRDAGYPVEQAP